MNSTITLREYLEKKKTFIIPSYQRGYIWGKNRVGETDSVTNLLNDFLIRFREKSDIFLQGFTVTEKDNEIIIIDGQQRTTFLYLLMQWLGAKEQFVLKYEIRKKSDDFLQNKPIDSHINESEEFQDIYFFKKTLNLIQDILYKAIEDKELFLKYLLDNVRFLYINIPEDQATKVFSMMNGSRAKMLPEEVIKAEILRIASKNNETGINLSVEWESNLLRSRYAREWDRWLHWWNQDKVKKLFRCDQTMGLLISTYLHQHDVDNLSFEEFKRAFLQDEQVKDAKDTFEALRKLQKRFEDAYNDCIKHNMIGGIIRVMKDGDARKFIKYYFAENQQIDLEKYYLLAFINLTHDQIVELDATIFEEKFKAALSLLEDNFLYETNKEFAFQFLLRLNIDQDIEQKRHFNFEIWDNRSLEHIYPKSKVGHFDENNNIWIGGDNEERNETYFTLKRDEIKDDAGNSTTEHSIGNLVLLYKKDNSEFNNSDFNEKKVKFFSPQRKDVFMSRHLLHTICVFAEKMSWTGKDIANNKQETINKFQEKYNAIYPL